MNIDYPEIVAGALLALAAHALFPHGSFPLHAAVEAVPSVFYERVIDRNGFSWKDIAWRNGTATLIEIRLHF
jgi:hypothetical protein